MWLSTRAHLHRRGLGRPQKEALQQPEYVGVSTQWAARILRIRGHELILVVVYLAVGLGLEGMNLVVMQEVGTFLRTQNSPFVSLGTLHRGEATGVFPPSLVEEPTRGSSRES